MKQLTTTLNKIKAHSPCESGWKKLLKHLGKTKADDEVLPFSVILESNGLDDALWCCRSAPEYTREWRLFAVWCALQVKNLMTDKRNLNVLKVAENFANGLATQAELAAARDAARNAARDAARGAAWDAAWTATRAAARAAQKEVFLWIVSGEFAKWEGR